LPDSSAANSITINFYKTTVGATRTVRNCSAGLIALRYMIIRRIRIARCCN